MFHRRGLRCPQAILDVCDENTCMRTPQGSKLLLAKVKNAYGRTGTFLYDICILHPLGNLYHRQSKHAILAGYPSMTFCHDKIMTSPMQFQRRKYNKIYSYIWKKHDYLTFNT